MQLCLNSRFVIFIITDCYFIITLQLEIRVGVLQCKLNWSLVLAACLSFPEMQPCKGLLYS